LNWYTTKIASTATLDVLQAKLDAQVEQARCEGRLDDEAQIYIVLLQGAVRLFVNEVACAHLPVLRSLALLPSSAPCAAERGRALLARESDDA
jgi:hypothetical protein